MRLGIFYPPTCVGLRYGFLSVRRGFSWHLVRYCALAYSRCSQFIKLCTFLDASSLFKVRKSRNIDRVSIAYASRPRLRSRLTQGRTSLPWKPWVYGGYVFNVSLRYSCLHTHSYVLQVQSPSPFDAHTTLSYHSISKMKSAASVSYLSPIIFGAGQLDE